MLPVFAPPVELYGTFRLNRARLGQPVKSIVNDALAEPPETISPRAIGKLLPLVTTGVQAAPDVWVRENPVICVA